MSGLNWDKQDFLECLEVVPEEDDENGLCYIYDIRKKSHQLVLMVRPDESTIYMSLAVEGSRSSLVDFLLYVRGRVRYVKDKEGESLEFLDAVVVPPRFWSFEYRGVYGDRRYTPPMTLKLSVKPEIALQFIDCPPGVLA